MCLYLMPLLNVYFARNKVFSDKSGLSSSQAIAGKLSLQLPTAQPTSTSPRTLRKPEYAISTLFTALSSEIR